MEYAKIHIADLYQKLGGEPIQGEGQIMARSLWAEDKTPSMSINTHKNVFNDKSTGIKGNVFNMIMGRSGRLTNREIFECYQRINQIMGHIENPIRPTIERRSIKTYPEWQSWDLTNAWHGLRHNFIDAFHGGKKDLVKALMGRYFGNISEHQIGHFSCNYNIGFTQFYAGTILISALAIPYIHLGRVTYIDLVSFDKSNKYIVAYPLPYHRKHKQHIKLNRGNIDFRLTTQPNVFSSFRIASSFFDPEMKNFVGATGNDNGNFSPFDSDRLGDYILICEGVKDAMIATKNGLNAIAFQGGARTLVSFHDANFLKLLKRRSSIGICFDNDEAGKTGARELKVLLEKKGAQNVNIVDLGDVCTGKGEDLTDYFIKYKGCKKNILEQAMGEA